MVRKNTAAAVIGAGRRLGRATAPADGALVNKTR